jgi:CMP-N-acetylneuraminic acid synthetase
LRKINKVYGVIPARAGSKRIPGKNKKEFCGKPLVLWTIETAMRSFIFHRIILSSDDQDIIELGCMFDIDVHHRIEELSQDGTTAIEVALNIISTYDLQPDDVIVWLQPTSPLRKSLHILDAFKKFKESQYPIYSLISCVEEPLVQYGFRVNSFGIMDPLYDKRYKYPTFLPNGAIYIMKVKDILKFKSFYTYRSLVYSMSKATSVDIDDYFDFEIAEYLMRQRKLGYEKK